MLNNPFITVVVPTYNRADLIAKTLESLQSQQYDNYEIIVVDDGSTDNTEAIVKSIADCRTYYVKKQNKERAAARNYGATLAKGDYINFFDSDDIALPNHLSEAALLIKKHNQPEWFHLGFAWATPDGKVFREINNYKGTTLNKLMSRGNPLSCNGVVIRKDIITTYSFNENLSASEDYELWCRLTSRFPLYFSNTITSHIIDHNNRSVRTINGDILISKLNMFVHYLQQDLEVIQFFGKEFSMIKMDSFSYIALHLAEQPKYKLKSIQYLLKALYNNTRLLFNKRFYAIIKNILIKW